MSEPDSGVYLQYIIINTLYAYVWARVYPPIMQDPAPSISRIAWPEWQIIMYII